MRLDHLPEWLCINTNHSKPRNFVTPWKEADGVGGWWFAWLTPWSSAPTFLAISTLRAARDQEVSKYCLQSGPWLVNGWLDLPWWSNCLSWYQYQSPPLYTTSTPLLHSVLFPSLANFSTKCGCLNLTLSQLWDNKESVQWSEEWLTVVTIDGTLTGTFLVEKLMRQIVILLHEKKIVSNSSIQVSG